MNTTTPTTLKGCRHWLTSQGLKLHAYQTSDGRRYRVTNYRGGLCFEGTRRELIDELATGWLRYA